MAHPARKVRSRTNPTEETRFVVRLGERGRLVLPGALRSSLGLQTGDALLLDLAEDGSIRLRSVRTQVGLLRGLLRRGDDDRSWVDEFLAERKAEADSE